MTTRAKPHFFHYRNWFRLDQNGSLAIWWGPFNEDHRWHYLSGDAAQGILYARFCELG
jgi:hypothetical protein